MSRDFTPWSAGRDYAIALRARLVEEQDALEPPPDEIEPGDSLEFRKHVEIEDHLERMDKLIENWDHVPDKMLATVMSFLDEMEARRPREGGTP